MTELVVIAPLTMIAVGDQFDQGAVPLHLTVLPPARVTQDQIPAIVDAVCAIAAATSPIMATARAYDQFGKDGSVAVTTVEPSAELRQLHHQLLTAAQSVGAVPRQASFTGDGYRPHITHTHDHRMVRPGEVVTLTTLAVLDCTLPSQRVTAAAPLSGLQ